jgi:hypothetical protein
MLTERSPYGGKLSTPLSSEEITSLLQQGREGIEQKAVEEVLLELAAVGFIWLSTVSKQQHKMAVCAVFYPYGLRLIA